MDPNIVHMNLRNFPNHGNSYTRLPPLCSQSNGFVERAIQTITKTLRKQKEDDSDSYLAILVLHPTKNSSVTSTSELLMKLKLQTRVEIFIKKGKLLKVFRHFIHVLQYYPKLNNGHHTKPSNLYVC